MRQYLTEILNFSGATCLMPEGLNQTAGKAWKSGRTTKRFADIEK